MTYKAIQLNAKGDIVLRFGYVDDTLENVMKHFERHKTEVDWKYYVIFARTKIIARITKS